MHYGDGFFTDMIEQEYGLNPNSHQDIQDQMAALLKENQGETEAKLKEIERESLRLNIKMNEEFKDKIEEVARLRATHVAELEGLKAELAAEYDAQ